MGLEEWISGASFYLSTVECAKAGELVDEKLKSIFNRLETDLYYAPRDLPKQNRGLVLKMSKEDAFRIMFGNSNGNLRLQREAMRKLE